MEEFKNGSDDFDSNHNPHKKKPNIFLDLLIGIGISVVAYAFIWFVFVSKDSVKMILLAEFIIISACGAVIVKFFRSAHTAAAVIMLLLISPYVLSLLLWGACSMMFRTF